jgi:hypothetical protein
MLFVVEIGAVTTNNDQQRNLVMHRFGPKRADGEQQAAVRLDINAELTGAFER